MKPTILRVCYLRLTTAIVLGLSAGFGSVSGNEGDFTIQPVARIPAGTIVDNKTDALRWNRLALLATPKIVRGDIEALSSSIRDIVAQNALTLMVTVVDSQTSNAASTPAPSGSLRRFSLREIGVGYSAPVSRDSMAPPKSARRIVITVDSASDLGVNLGFIGRQVLSSKEEQLGDLKQIAKTSELAIFDAPSVMFIGGEHQKAITRHFLWISPETGRGAMMIWLITGQNSNRRVVDTPIRLVPFGTRESRNVHVDEEEFSFLGVPTEMAFAVEDLPPGGNVPWTDECKQLATLPRYTVTQLKQLASSFNNAIAGAQAVSQ